MEITVPVEMNLGNLIEQLDRVTEQMERLSKKAEYMDKMLKVSDLPPYPTQNQLTKALGIGQSRLNDWIAMGLKKQIWSTGSIRYDHEEVRRFLKENFEI